MFKKEKPFDEIEGNQVLSSYKPLWFAKAAVLKHKPRAGGTDGHGDHMGCVASQQAQPAQSSMKSCFLCLWHPPRVFQTSLMYVKRQRSYWCVPYPAGGNSMEMEPGLPPAPPGSGTRTIISMEHRFIKHFYLPQH